MRTKNGMYKNCLTCNKEFYVIKSQSESRKYCNHKCSVKTGKYHPRFNGGLHDIACLNCKEIFQVKKNRINNGAKFCSFYCKNTFKLLNPNLYKKTKNNCTCKNCGKEFHLKPYAIINGGGVYCSRSCKHDHMSVTMTGINNPNYKHGKAYERNFYKETSQRWINNNRDKISLYRSKQRHARRSAEGKFSIKDIRDMIIKQKHKCAFCFKSIKKKYHIDHIMPIKLGGNNYIDNIQLLCPTCNMRKGAKHPLDWAAENGRLF